MGEVVILEVPGLAPTPPAPLTRAEAEVLERIVQGWTNAQIAHHRGTSVRTVANQVSRLLARLHVGSRHQLISWALGGRE